MTKTAPLANKLQPPAKAKNGRKFQPLWKGPSVDGITFSLLSKFLVCRERFRLKVVEGKEEDTGFNKAMEYGSMWHEAEEALCGKKPWQPKIIRYSNSLISKYPTSERDILKWTKICSDEFATYIRYWEKHQDEKGRQPILEEKAFRVPYELPSGRTVVLRGKWDAVMLLSAPTKKEPELYRTWQELWPKAKFGITNQENKTKGEIDELGILSTVDRNLQTMIYHFAIRVARDLILKGVPVLELFNPPPPEKELNLFLTHLADASVPITGVLYNVIRRPLADRFAIKQRKTETESEFLARVAAGIEADPPHYFKRWRVLLSPTDIAGFQKESFNPILEQLCDWWEWVQCDPFDPWRPRKPSELGGLDYVNAMNDSSSLAKRFSAEVLKGLDEELIPNRIHWQAPWGVYDSLAGGFRGDYFEFLTTGRDYGMRKITTLFPELNPNGKS